MTGRRAAMRGAAALAAAMALAAGLAGCSSQDLAAGEEATAIGLGAALSPVAAPVVQATLPVAKAVSDATRGCAPDLGPPVFSADGGEVAILGRCPRAVGLDILVAPVRDGAALTRHPIHRFGGQLGEFTSATTLTWLTRDDPAAGPSGPRASNTLSVYEHDLTTDADRLVAADTTPFRIEDFSQRRGEGCTAIEAHDVGGTPSRTYLLKDGKLTPLALPEGEAWPVYWDSVQKAFVLRLGQPFGPHATPITFARAGCDGKVEALPAAFAPDGSPLRDIYQPASSPGAPLVMLAILNKGLGRLDLAAAARTGTAAVAPVPETWPPSQGTSGYSLTLSPRGRYFGVDYNQTFYALRPSDGAAVFSHARGRDLQFARSAFSPDESRYVLVGGLRVEVYPITAGR